MLHALQSLPFKRIFSIDDCIDAGFDLRSQFATGQSVRQKVNGLLQHSILGRASRTTGIEMRLDFQAFLVGQLIENVFG